MSRYDASRIEKPAHFRIAPLKRGRGKREVHVIGFDSEQDTRTARPMLLQFNQYGTEADTELRTIPDRDRHDALHEFMRYVHAVCHQKNVEYVIVGFNLQYEFTQLYGDLPRDLIVEDEYEFRYRLEDASGNLVASYIVHVMNAKRYGVVITNEATHRRVKVIDAAAFWSKLSLDTVAAMLDIGRKVTMTNKKFTRDDLTNEHFLEYARQDAYLTRKIGEYIIDLHEMFDVPTCITAPHFAARVFRRHFLPQEIALPDPDLEQAGLSSYHGGKNGYYLGRPMHLSNVYAYDITSAYPEAMRQLPNPVASRWEWQEGYERGLHALWKISGTYRACRYHGMMDDGNGWYGSGPITDAWITSYELDAIVDAGELDITECVGWVMRGETGTGPLVQYVDTFFDMKRNATGAKRNAAKLFLNSLYGKFFQKVPLGVVGYYDAETLDELGNVTYIETDPTQAFDYQAGGLYHPPIASLITGFVRGKMHRLEHRYNAVMTSTDGFFATQRPDPADIGTDLGALTVERGDLSIWRERLYDFRPHAGRSWALFRHGKSPSKYALHGFRGSVTELRAIPLAFGKYGYEATQVITNKLAMKTYRGAAFRPGTFARLAYILDLSQMNAPP